MYLSKSERGEAHANRRSGLFVRRSNLSKYLSAMGQKLLYLRIANRGLYKGTGSDGSQIDLLT